MHYAGRNNSKVNKKTQKIHIVKSESIPEQNMIIMNANLINIKLSKLMGPSYIPSLSYNGCKKF